MFGSDQMVWADAIGMAVENIRSARFLTQKQKRDIFTTMQFVSFDQVDAASALAVEVQVHSYEYPVRPRSYCSTFAASSTCSGRARTQ